MYVRLHCAVGVVGLNWLQGLSCTVRPLLFDFQQLNVQQVRQLMSVKAGDTQLYMSVLVSILKKYQMRAQRPSFDDLKRELDVRAHSE